VDGMEGEGGVGGRGEARKGSREREQPRTMRKNRTGHQGISPQDVSVTPVSCSQECNVESYRRFGPAASPLRRGRAAACNSTRQGGRLGDGCDGVGSMARVGTPPGYGRAHGLSSLHQSALEFLSAGHALPNAVRSCVGGSVLERCASDN